MNTPTKINSKWVRFRSAVYLRGKGLSFGAGPDHIFPDLAMDGDKFSIAIDSVRYANLDAISRNADFIAAQSLDHVFIGPRLVDIPDPAKLVKALSDKLKIGGHLIIHTHLGKMTEEQLGGIVGSFAKWREKFLLNRDGQLLGVFKLINRSSIGIDPPPPPSGKPRACIARYGAIGDMIMISPLIKQLYDDGYEVTMNVTPYCAEVLKNNPYVHNIILQEREIIPNPDLGEYWKEWIGEYDKYINLSESIEGKLLKVEGRRDYFTTKEWRNDTCGSVNYYDQTMRLGGYPNIKGTKGELYFSREEEKNCKRFRDQFKDKFFVLWGLRGSSFHKQYPLLEPVLCDWLNANPKAIVMLTGGPGEKELEFNHPQVLPMSGKIPLREVFCLTKFADLVVGPESAIINAAACHDVRKLVFLSHSSEQNLCAYWTNYKALAPEGVDCYPCHQLHYTKPSCPTIQITVPGNPNPVWEGPICAGMGVTGERLQRTLDEEISSWQTRSQTQLVEV
jgi:ADP-heptose:LPS heptosyltransferase